MRVFDMVFLLLLFTVAAIDARTMRIPDRLNAAIALLAVGRLAAAPFSCQSVLLGAVLISVPMLVMDFALPGSFGGGDVKLCASAGLFLGAARVLYGAVVGLLLAGVYAAGLVVRQGLHRLLPTQRKTAASVRKMREATFPLGPFLAAGFSAAIFY